MSSSVQEKVRAVEKEKKRQRTLAREGALDAIRQRQEPENHQPEYKEVDVREIPKETSYSDSVVNSGEEEVKVSKPKKKSKKASKKS
tara:strand:+ start:125 stop:385 length:261 start_codon:yes stop_codon:yes gene_type:complete